MNTRLKTLGVGLAMLTVVGTGATMGHSAFAQDATPAATATAGNDRSSDANSDGRGGMKDGSHDKRGGHGPMGGPGRGAHVDMEALATFLGITTDQIATEWEAGSSLAEIAEAHGKTRDELKAFIIEAFTADLDARIDRSIDDPRPSTDDTSDAVGGETTPDTTPAASSGLTI